MQPEPQQKYARMDTGSAGRASQIALNSSLGFLVAPHTKLEHQSPIQMQSNQGLTFSNSTLASASKGFVSGVDSDSLSSEDDVPRVKLENIKSCSQTNQALGSGSHIGQREAASYDNRPESVKQAMENIMKSNAPKPGKKTKGKVKIKIGFIKNKLRRYTTFSKRKTGIMKKAYELATLTGTEVMVLVASETGHVYTFATEKLQPMITSESGKALIQTCLNTPSISGTQKDHGVTDEAEASDNGPGQAASNASVASVPAQTSNNYSRVAQPTTVPTTQGAPSRTPNLLLSPPSAQQHQSSALLLNAGAQLQKFPPADKSVFSFPATSVANSSTQQLLVCQAPQGLLYTGQHPHAGHSPGSAAPSTPVVFSLPNAVTANGAQGEVMTFSIPLNMAAQLHVPTSQLLQAMGAGFVPRSSSCPSEERCDPRSTEIKVSSTDHDDPLS